MWRRIIAIPCDAKVAPEEEVNQMEKQFYEEAAGILNWTLTFVPALTGRGDFVAPECCRALTRQERIDANSVAGWFTNCVYVDGETFVGSTKMLFDEYVNWANDRRYIPKAIGNFRNELSRLLKPHQDSGKVKYTRERVERTKLVSASHLKSAERVELLKLRGWRGLRIVASLDDGRGVSQKRGPRVHVSDEAFEKEADPDTPAVEIDADALLDQLDD